MDATYERTILGIEKTKREYAYRLFQCLVVAIRPLRVEELAEVLTVLLDTEEGSEYHADWRPEDAQQEVLSTCSSLITIAKVDGSSVVQFSHFSVKEFLMSSRLANAGEHLSRYHILPHPSHTTIARASLGVLLNLGDNVDKGTIENHPLALYASRYWVDHAKFEGVASSIQDLMERLFDREKSHFATWVWLYDVDRPWEGHMATAHPPMKPKAAPLYYATLSGFPGLVKYLALTHPEDVDANVGCYGTALQAAVAKREVDTTLELLQHGADKYILDGTGESTLHNASRYGHLDLVKMLLKSGMGINLQNRTGGTPLSIALFRGNIEVAHFLIQRGADVNCRNNKGWTPLHEAARRGHIEVVRLLLDLDNVVQVRSRNPSIPIISASEGGHVEVSRFLTEHQADVNSADNKGRTSLHLASYGGHPDVVQLLLDHGAEVDVLNKNQRTPLDLASLSKNGILDVARLLIKHGSNVNSQDTSGWTSLHFAARSGQLDIVKLLLDSGADIGMRNGRGKTAFDIAFDKGKHDVVNFLAKHDGNLGSRLRESVCSTSLEPASPNKFGMIEILEPHRSDSEEEDPDDKQSTSLLIAVQNGSIGVIKKLLNRGADANERDGFSWSPLYAASRAGKLEIARTLINYGADVNCRDTFGWTALHTAAQAGHVDIVRLLLDNGADVNAVQRNYQTPLHLASMNGHLPIVLLLLERGANVQVRNSKGKTPSQEASGCGFSEIVRSLSEFDA